MARTSPENFPELIEAMKAAAAALRLAESLSSSVGTRGVAQGRPAHRARRRLFVKEENAERALEALVAAGMKAERPPEGWLLKAYYDGTLIDLIFRPSGDPIDDGHLERAEELDVMAHPMLVASLDDVMVTRLLSLTEQEPDFTSVLEFTRSLREQIDWDVVRERTTASAFARAFFTLIEELGIVETLIEELGIVEPEPSSQK